MSELAEVIPLRNAAPTPAPKELYEVGEIPPLGHVPKNMYAWAIRKDREPVVAPPVIASMMESVSGFMGGKTDYYSRLKQLKQPFLILHGENDLAIPVEDARKAFAAAGSTDKQLRLFTVAQGGAEHVQADQPDQARQLIADWFTQRLSQNTT